MELFTKRLRLEEISFSSLEDIHHLHSLPETDEYNTLGIPSAIDETKSLLSEWLDRQKETPRMSYVFRIGLMDSNEFVGLVALNLGRLKYKNAEVWYKILPQYWNKGYTTEALIRLLQFGFSDLHLHRIEAGCAPENIGSVRVLEKAGMIKEGCRRKILPVRGAWVDSCVYAVLETDFQQQ